MITYDTEHRPEVANFLDIASGFTGATPEELAIRLGSGGGRALKELVTEAVNEGLRGHRELPPTPQIPRNCDASAAPTAAATVAATTLTEVRGAMSMDY